MKKYICPSVEIIELQANEGVAYNNPLETATVTAANGKITTTYSLALLDEASQI